MSKAYRKWKENIKAYRRGELPRCKYDYNILLTDTSMAAYRRIRRVRQRELKRMKVIQRLTDRIIKMPVNIEWQVYGNPYQVSEAEKISQVNKYWRQNETVH